ncbi:hypothetical protein KCW65_27080, partial [Mycobacterium tuberculosis]|nr:hypothetical protein [Mycobacterium tuberculosis]
MTMGAIDASRRLDQWPAVVGIDDFPGADLLDVTVVDPDVDAMSAEAVRVLTGDHPHGAIAGLLHLTTSLLAGMDSIRE